MGDNDDNYLLARAIQFFAPGIPQVYYVGLLAGKNDLKLLEETKIGRNINRHYYSAQEVAQEVERNVVKKLIRLMEFRNEHAAFDGEFILEDCGETELQILRRNGDEWARLYADLKNKTFIIEYTQDREVNKISI